MPEINYHIRSTFRSQNYRLAPLLALDTAQRSRQLPGRRVPEANCADLTGDKGLPAGRIHKGAARFDCRDGHLLVVCDYGDILKPPALTAARLGGVNLHGSLLPKYRGAAPVQWAILNGDAETGNTVIQMTPGLDAGPILGVDRVPTTPFGRGEAPRKPVLTTTQVRTRKAKRALAARGLTEAVTWSFISKAQAELFGGGQAELALANP